MTDKAQALKEIKVKFISVKIHAIGCDRHISVLEDEIEDRNEGYIGGTAMFATPKNNVFEVKFHAYFNTNDLATGQSKNLQSHIKKQKDFTFKTCGVFVQGDYESEVSLTNEIFKDVVCRDINHLISKDAAPLRLQHKFSASAVNQFHAALKKQTLAILNDC